MAVCGGRRGGTAAVFFLTFPPLLDLIFGSTFEGGADFVPPQRVDGCFGGAVDKNEDG